MISKETALVMISEAERQIESLKKALKETEVNFQAIAAHKMGIVNQISSLEARILDLKQGQLELDVRGELPP